MHDVLIKNNMHDIHQKNNMHDVKDPSFINCIVGSLGLKTK